MVPEETEFSPGPRKRLGMGPVLSVGVLERRAGLFLGSYVFVD